MSAQNPTGPAMPPAPPSQGTVSPNRNVMLVLAYLWLLALIPLLTEKEDREVQWHAKHGLVILVLEVIAWVVYFVLSIIPGVGCVIMILLPFIWLLFVVVRVIAVVKAFGGQRFIIPGVSAYADRF